MASGSFIRSLCVDIETIWWKMLQSIPMIATPLQYLPESVSNPYIRHSTHKLALRWTLLPVVSDGADDYFFGLLDEPRVTRQVHPVRYTSSHNTNADLQVYWFLHLRLRLIMIPIARLRGLKGVCSGSNSWFVASPADSIWHSGSRDNIIRDVNASSTGNYMLLKYFQVAKIMFCLLFKIMRKILLNFEFFNMKTLCAVKIIVDAEERAWDKKGSGECSPSILDGGLGVNPVGCVCFDEISIKVHKPLHCGITFFRSFHFIYHHRFELDMPEIPLPLVSA